MELPRVLTPLTEGQTAEIFLDTFPGVFGRFPTKQEAELLLALLWNENARGSKIIQHNWGNIASAGRSNDVYWRPPWYFQEGTLLHDRMLQGLAPSAFRAYPNHESGAHAWLSLLATERYRPVMAAAAAGDPSAFAAALNVSYCPDPECARLGPTYASLQGSIDRLGYFAALDSGNLNESPGQTPEKKKTVTGA